jgi:hypothetical protein
MFSFLPHRDAKWTCGTPPTFFGPLQEAPLVMVHW